MISFNKIVNKLCKKGGKIVFLHDIFEIIDPEYKKEQRTKLNKTVYRLKSESHIIPLKNGVYIIPETEDKKLNSVDLLDKYYLQLLKKTITHEVGSSYYIGGKKSLEFHMKDFSIPEKIFICNRNTNKRVKVGPYEIIFKTVSGKHDGKKINLYSKFSVFTLETNIQSIPLKLASIELSLLDACLIGESYNGVEVNLINKCIKKYGDVLDREIFREIAKYKYIMSFNRLKELSKHTHGELYKEFLDIIKTNGSLFIGESGRGI